MAAIVWSVEGSPSPHREGLKGAELGRIPEMTLARMLLRELVAEGKA